MADYGCMDYRTEMILASLHRQLAEKDLTEEERKKLVEEINKLEEEMDL